MRRPGAAILCIAVSAAALGATRASARPWPSQCVRPPGMLVRDDHRRAEELLRNVYTLSPHDSVRLPANPSWRENPFRDRNWQFQYHSLRYTWHLLAEWLRTGDDRYRRRFVFLLRDWVKDNPPSRPRSSWAWSDHSTAWRGAIYACASQVLPSERWLRDAVRLHGETLARPSFYVGYGNHALAQDIGLLALGCASRRRDWTSLAARRISRLFTPSVDAQGATNEQSIEYQLYNWRLYTGVRTRFDRCGIAEPASFKRLELMPGFLAHATLPNGEYEMIGDTSRNRAVGIAGTPAEFAATGGRSGPKPGRPWALYRTGFLFGRTGWGETRPFADETFFSLRWGRGPFIHGHADGGAVTLYAYGSRLLLDSGKYKYERDWWRQFFIGRRAHNVITMSPADYDFRAPTDLLTATNNAAVDFAELRPRGYRGVDMRRRVLFSRRLGFMVVEDRISSRITRTYRQLWHLPEDAGPHRKGTTVTTRRPRGNLVITQLAGRTAVTIASGRSAPIQGWRSYRYGERIAAPTVEAAQTGRRAHYLTLIVPRPDGGVPVRVSRVRVMADGFSMFVGVGRDVDQVQVRGRSVTVTARADCPMPSPFPPVPRLPGPAQPCPAGDW